ncbi:CBS domain-containing protein [Paenibacillus castaneae]|uniref:CBS domain-containing protein n=1 Tax=Paenibacillus castaneae TaxID=474957 RepID=UPI000C9C7DE9|nr:CBS domain-containing protein [Paenibacillus castaneae]NIK79168.1 CBS domain-containing protein [Paenibacillus castaneae]
MKAHEIMITDVFKVTEQDTIRSILKQFIDNRISGLPVVNNKNEITAYVSDGDIMRFIGKHKDFVIDTIYYMDVIKGDDDEFEERAKKIVDLNVMEIAQKKVHKVKWDDEVEDIAAILGKKRIKKLPVERNGRLVGIISRGDVIRNSFKGLL